MSVAAAVTPVALELAGGPVRGLACGGQPDVVLLHGWADSAACWHEVLERLGEAGLGALALDVPDVASEPGMSPVGDLATLDELTAAVTARWPDTVLAGYSLGGLLALRRAQAAPLPAGVVALAPPGVAVPGWYSPVATLAPALRLALAVPAPVPALVVRRAGLELYRLLGLARPERMSARLVAEHARGWRDARQARRQLGALLGLVEQLARSGPLDLAATGCPVVLAWGEHDHVVPAAHLEVTAQALAHVRSELLAGCGHVAAIDDPDGVAALLVAAVEGREGGGRTARRQAPG